MTIVEFLQNNLPVDDPALSAISLGIIFLVCYDFYHILFSAVLSHFKK